jgi:hypothetical protein
MSYEKVKKQDIKNSAKRIVSCAIENNVSINIINDFVDKDFFHFTWGKGLVEVNCFGSLCIGVDLNFHKEQTTKILENIKSYKNNQVNKEIKCQKMNH